MRRMNRLKIVDHLRMPRAPKTNLVWTSEIWTTPEIHQQRCPEGTRCQMKQATGDRMSHPNYAPYTTSSFSMLARKGTRLRSRCANRLWKIWRLTWVTTILTWPPCSTYLP
ncbi:uncharacterized protein LOC142348202 [Convolutriloba macropyga]|uniref:uncharacterized protein LOC142348202 n=1 Tax=Convolutriloba macropyga TaxID=536237 RepID=UPI003F522EE2